jgi:hypothetical protein
MAKFLYSSGLSLLLCLASGTGSRAAELVMFESSTCEWCEAWHAQIGGIYGKTEEAKIAPLRRVSIEDPIPDDLAQVRGIHYTPTFVLMSDGREVGRILGYPGENFFWGLLDIELRKLEESGAGDARRACAERPKGGNSYEKTGDHGAAC